MSTHQYLFSKHTPDPVSSRAKLLYVNLAQCSAEWSSTPHADACTELFFITGGHGMFQVRQDQFPVALNDLVIVNASVPHAESSQNGSPMTYMVLGVEGLRPLSTPHGFVLNHLRSDHPVVGVCLRLMAQELRDGQPGYEPVCQKLLEIILLELHRRPNDSLAAPVEVSARANRECDQVRRYIDSHYKENLTLDQLAAMVHINKYYLSHTFRKEFDTSPISYLISRRIQESCFLLRETDQSLSQIAQALGFSSLSYFSQSFRKMEDISPMEYRKQHRRQRTSS